MNINEVSTYLNRAWFTMSCLTIRVGHSGDRGHNIYSHLLADMQISIRFLIEMNKIFQTKSMVLIVERFYE